MELLTITAIVSASIIYTEWRIYQQEKEMTKLLLMQESVTSKRMNHLGDCIDRLTDEVCK